MSFEDAAAMILPIPQLAGGGLPATSGFFGAGSTGGGRGGAGAPSKDAGHGGLNLAKLGCSILPINGQCGSIIHQSPRFIQSRSFDKRMFSF